MFVDQSTIQSVEGDRGQSSERLGPRNLGDSRVAPSCVAPGGEGKGDQIHCVPQGFEVF